MLKLSNVNLEYVTQNKQHTNALKNINLHIEKGKRYAIVGASGCGKSSLMQVLSGLVKPTSGEILFRGEKLTKPHVEIGIILQDYGLFPWKTVYQNVALGLVLNKTPKAEIKAKVEPIIKELGLWEMRNKFPNQLSGGQRQRIAIGRVLVLCPEVILMDEPFSALDVATQENLENMVLRLCEKHNLTLVMVTHNIEEAVFLGEEILVFGEEPGRISAVIENPRSGDIDYRSSAEFYEQSATLRKMLGGANYDR